MRVQHRCHRRRDDNPLDIRSVSLDGLKYAGGAFDRRIQYVVLKISRSEMERTYSVDDCVERRVVLDRAVEGTIDGNISDHGV